MKDILVKTNLRADRTFSYFPRLNLSIALSKSGTPLDKAFCSFPLILPEPDAGIRKGLDELERSRGLLNKLDIDPRSAAGRRSWRTCATASVWGLSVKGP